jgi:hypothetical protein
MAPVPEGAQRSDDGYYWWDGSAWQQIPEDERTGPASSSASSSDSQSSASGNGLSHEQLAQITSEDQLDEQSKPYFQPDPDKYPDDASDAEGADVLSDEPAATA